MVKTIMTKRSFLKNCEVQVDVWDYTKKYLSIWTFSKNGKCQDQITLSKEELQQMLLALS